MSFSFLSGFDFACSQSAQPLSKRCLALGLAGLLLVGQGPAVDGDPPREPGAVERERFPLHMRLLRDLAAAVELPGLAGDERPIAPGNFPQRFVHALDRLDDQRADLGVHRRRARWPPRRRSGRDDAERGQHRQQSSTRSRSCNWGNERSPRRRVDIMQTPRPRGGGPNGGRRRATAHAARYSKRSTSDGSSEIARRRTRSGSKPRSIR